MFDEPGFLRGDEFNDADPLLHHFVYCSRAADSVDDAEVCRIVETAQRHNLERGITGVMVFGSGVFFQWIEGPSAQIWKLIAILHDDTRHHDIVTLDQGEERRERLYPDWDMEKVGADDIRLVLRDALQSSKDGKNASALKRIIDQFDAKPLEALGRS